MDQDQPEEPAAEPVIAAPIQPERFAFTGSGDEYFRIWIVNIMLTILTLGIYSAWAKVRRLQFFYRHTQLAGASFDYHGDPVSILIGRVVALALVIAYNYASQRSLGAALVSVIALVVVLPWLLRNSFRFRLRYSSYRGLRFAFRASTQQAYATFLPFGIYAIAFLLLSAWAFNGDMRQNADMINQDRAPWFFGATVVMTLAFGLLVPWLHQRLKVFQHGNAWFGRTAFSFSAKPGAFYGIYVRTGLLSVGLVLALGLLVSATMVGVPRSSNYAPGGVLLMLPLYLALYAAINAYFTAGIGNLVWNATELGEHRLESTLRLWPLMKIQLTNAIFIVLTLGLFMPWAAVRLARYRAEQLVLLPASSLDEFVASSDQEVGAVGEEALEMFDFDIGL